MHIYCALWQLFTFPILYCSEVMLDSTLSLKPQIAAISNVLDALQKDSAALLYYGFSIAEHNHTQPLADMTQLLQLYTLHECILLLLPGILHQVAKLSRKLSYRDHITPAPHSLCWLPVCEGIHFKLALLLQYKTNLL